jgi:hypothetical protein
LPIWPLGTWQVALLEIKTGEHANRHALHSFRLTGPRLTSLAFCRLSSVDSKVANPDGYLAVQSRTRPVPDGIPTDWMSTPSYRGAQGRSLTATPRSHVPCRCCIRGSRPRRASQLESDRKSVPVLAVSWTRRVRQFRLAILRRLPPRMATRLSDLLARPSLGPPPPVRPDQGQHRLKIATSTDGPLAQGSIAMQRTYCNDRRSPFKFKCWHGVAMQETIVYEEGWDGLLILLMQLATISRPFHRLDRLGFPRRCTRGCVGPLTHVGNWKVCRSRNAPSHRQLT